MFFSIRFSEGKLWLLIKIIYLDGREGGNLSTFLFPEHNSVTFRNTLMILDRIIEHVSITDTLGQLVLLTTILNHKTCINTSRQVLEKTLFAINAIFTQDNNLSKTKVEGSLQKTNATCSKCKTNLILTYSMDPEGIRLHNHKNVSPRSCQINTNYFQTFHP